ncbi:MAG: rhomboid family intramembrane serine protease [Pirellula sp.]
MADFSSTSGTREASPVALRDQITRVLLFVGVVWGVFFMDWILPADLTAWGLVPRVWSGLCGIVTSPFLHANFSHLLSNSVPLLILLFLLCSSQPRAWPTVVEIVVLGGILLWLFGRSAVHVGASGLIYGLIAFLIVSGVRERHLVSMVVAILVGFLYGGTLLSGVLPTVGPSVSWDGHLCGAIAGGAIAVMVTAAPPSSNAA